MNTQETHNGQGNTPQTQPSVRPSVTFPYYYLMFLSDPRLVNLTQEGSLAVARNFTSKKIKDVVQPIDLAFANLNDENRQHLSPPDTYEIPIMNASSREDSILKFSRQKFGRVLFNYSNGLEPPALYNLSLENPKIIIPSGFHRFELMQVPEDEQDRILELIYRFGKKRA